MKEGAIPWQRCEKQGWSRSSTRMLRKQATCRHPFSGPLLRPVSCGWVAASGSWVIPLLSGTSGGDVWEETHAVIRERLRVPFLPQSRGHEIWGVASSLFLLFHRRAVGTRGKALTFPEATARWEESFLTRRLRDVSCVSGNIHSVCFRGWGGGGGGVTAFCIHTHSCLCWPRIFAMYPQNPWPTKVQKHVEQSTHLELCSVNGHKNVSGAGSTCGHLARGSNAGGPAPGIRVISRCPRGL